jgi:hypothetical protein
LRRWKKKHVEQVLPGLFWWSHGAGVVDEREKERKAAAQGEKSGMLKGISC